MEMNGWAKPEPERRKPAKKIVKRVAAAGAKQTVAKPSSKFREFLAKKTAVVSSLPEPPKTPVANEKQSGMLI
jgi:hypothetical protein